MSISMTMGRSRNLSGAGNFKNGRRRQPSFLTVTWTRKRLIYKKKLNFANLYIEAPPPPEGICCFLAENKKRNIEKNYVKN